MELAAAALSSLLPKLGSLLSDEYNLQKEVRGENRFLQAEMESMQAALNRVSKLPAHQIDELNKIWVRDLKELVYDIEDSVDAFMVRVDAHVHDKPHSFRRFFDRTIGLLAKAKSRNHIADDIQDIKKRIDEVSKRKERYNSLDVVVQPDTVDIDPRMPSLYQDAAKLVGIDGPTKKLVDLLTRGEGAKKQKLRVISIVGAGGLGKTTIANSVYERLQGQFESHAFVSVSPFGNTPTWGQQHDMCGTGDVSARDKVATTAQALASMAAEAKVPRASTTAGGRQARAAINFF
ncbi:hypothetical protein C2845_PM18G04860 [Panicum miliaceum]|uniref:Uncharacterized protein n=1 Tax=Panicum miliaceum TaxID=4540 RepID=A0A3L6PH93_PANMI|nr:hypothetical protein C2845_PM18G04860 [Panicum miliaceum]